MFCLVQTFGLNLFLFCFFLFGGFKRSEKTLISPSAQVNKLGYIEFKAKSSGSRSSGLRVRQGLRGDSRSRVSGFKAWDF